ncbi:MAG: PAS domain S-box protein, partial [Burkholderiaceae bacterium]
MIPEFPPNAEYEAIFEAMSAGVVLTGADGRFLRANRAYYAMTGYDAAEFLAMSYRELNHPDDVPQSEAAAADLLEGRRDTVRLEQRIRHRAGHYLWVYSTTTLRWNAGAGKPEYAISVVEDISERKTDEAAHARIRDELAVSLQLTQSVLDHSLDVICILGPDGRFLRTSRSSAKVWGYASEELQGLPFQELVHPDDMAASLRVAGELAAGLPAVNFENRHLHRDGTVVDMLWNASWSEEHQTMIAIGRDVSRIKRALRQIEDSEQRFRSFFEYHPDAIFTLDMTPRLVAVNEAMVQLSGYSREELLSPQPPSLAAPECVEEAVRALYAAMAGEIVKYDGIGIRKDGSRFETVTVHFPMVVDGRIVGVHGIAKDVTQANENERRIKHLATHDALTGLPNRNLLEDRLLHAMEQARRIGCRMGVLFLDLNRFKVVNDSLGH